MARCYRLIIGTTSSSITIVTHDCPRLKFCANCTFSWQIQPHNYILFRIKHTEHLKMCFQRTLQILTCGYWNMSFERKLLTISETSTFKCIFPLDKWSYYYVVFIVMKNKHSLYFSDYYKTIAHVKTSNSKCFI